MPLYITIISGVCRGGVMAHCEMSGFMKNFRITIISIKLGIPCWRNNNYQFSIYLHSIQWYVTNYHWHEPSSVLAKSKYRVYIFYLITTTLTDFQWKLIIWRHLKILNNTINNYQGIVNFSKIIYVYFSENYAEESQFKISNTWKWVFKHKV